MLEIAREFGDLFSQYEHALKRCGFLRPNRADAQADWRSFASTLGQEFFDEVAARKIAENLIDRPPGKLMREGLNWERPDRPLEDAVALFERGVCRVRNSLFHGEKFVGDMAQLQRDRVLVVEATAVLKAAADKVPAVARLLR